MFGATPQARWQDGLAGAGLSAAFRASALLVLFHLPVIGLPAIVAALPVLFLVPGLSDNGPHVAYIAGYAALKSGYAWLCVGSYYFSVIFCVEILKRIRRQRHMLARA